jgi:aromatic-L-amino-acid decarboxylase
MSADDLDRHTQAWVARVNRSGRAYLTPAVLDGRWMVRVSIGAELTEREHVEQLWAIMQVEASLPPSRNATADHRSLGGGG